MGNRSQGTRGYGVMTMEQLQRGYDNQLPDSYDEPEAPTLPDLGTCPHCRTELAWDGLDDTKAWCPTPGCKYDNGLSETENRRLWQDGQS